MYFTANGSRNGLTALWHIEPEKNLTASVKFKAIYTNTMTIL